MMMKNIFLAFIPLFVAVDAIGVLPIFISLTDRMKKKERFNVIAKSVATALCLAIVFIFLGKAIFKLLNITMADFMIAGGALLFCIAVMDLLNPVKKRRIPPSELGFVPLGTPLITGPAVLTTSLLMLDAYGLYPTLASVVINIFLAGIIFMSADILIKILGTAGTRALSKIMSLFLAAIAVMMMRKGILIILSLHY